MFLRQMFYYNENVELTASVKPTNKININKHIFLLFYPKFTLDAIVRIYICLYLVYLLVLRLQTVKK